MRLAKELFYFRIANARSTSFSEKHGNYLLLQYIVPLLIGLKLVDVSLYNEFVAGKNLKPIIDMYSNSDIGDWLGERLLNEGETLEELEGRVTVTKKERLQSLYDAIFVKEYTANAYSTVIGRFRFDGDLKTLRKWHQVCYLHMLIIVYNS